MRTLLVLVVLVVLVFAVRAFAGENAADESIARLAKAFEDKDRAFIAQAMIDPWSGQRFLSTWDDAAWKRAARVLRGARLKSSTADERIYAVPVANGSRDVTMTRRAKRWLLDYNSFLGPFPTF